MSQNTELKKTTLIAKTKKWPVFMKVVSWILVFAVLNISGGCMNYFKVRKATGSTVDTIDSQKYSGKKLVVHLDNQAWYLENIEVSDKELVGELSDDYLYTLKNPLRPDGTNRYRKNKNINESYILNEVHIYVTELSKENSLKTTIPLNAIQKIEIYEKDKAATIGSWTLGILGASALAFGILLIIVLLTKSSCPFIYVFDGETYQLAGEIYSGTIQPGLERHDYLKLKQPDINQTEFQLKIANEVKEIQHTNLLELWVFDHNKAVSVCVDKYGDYHTLSLPVSASKATNFEGTDVTNFITNRDDLVYTSVENKNEMQETDGIILEFPKPVNAQNAKLSINAKNSFVLDFMMGEFQNEFGNLYKKWQKKQANVPAEQLREWSLDQNIPLSVYIENNGNWEFADYFNLAGPIAMKEDILSIPVSDINSETLKIKLEFGNFFWEIDYAGVDFSKNVELDYQLVPVKSAIDQKGKDVSSRLKENDNKYYIQPEVGDFAEVIFDLPSTSSETRTIILHSKGWYKILREPSGKPDREYLETFREPGRFNRFVNDYMKNLTIE